MDGMTDTPAPIATPVEVSISPEVAIEALEAWSADRAREGSHPTLTACVRVILAALASSNAEIERLKAERDEANAFRDKACEAYLIVQHRADALTDQVGRLREALEWYQAKVAGCRKITPEGEDARRALDKDGGSKARAALAPTEPDWDDLRGRAPDATEGMSSEAFVRGLRDAWR